MNTAYYLCKKERSYSDYSDLWALEEKNGMKVTNGYKNDRDAAGFIDIGQSMKDSFISGLFSANYYSVLTDGSTDASILEQEVMYVLYLSKDKFFSC